MASYAEHQVPLDKFIHIIYKCMIKTLTHIATGGQLRSISSPHVSTCALPSPDPLASSTFQYARFMRAIIHSPVSSPLLRLPDTGMGVVRLICELTGVAAHGVGGVCGPSSRPSVLLMRASQSPKRAHQSWTIVVGQSDQTAPFTSKIWNTASATTQLAQYQPDSDIIVIKKYSTALSHPYLHSPSPTPSPKSHIQTPNPSPRPAQAVQSFLALFPIPFPSQPLHSSSAPTTHATPPVPLSRSLVPSTIHLSIARAVREVRRRRRESAQTSA
ncbi:hypothetical protein DE146DRAFT_636023 [Phaeosphaeria sp. MPI-PUGE-AT-0046c]|nr:hypothetical protein DE146DRAFT_636023 [Phaeosphaeria sp. MPI-PUGE-AT-0046c]